MPHNLAFDWEIGDKAATEAQFAKAAHVTRLTVVNNRIVVSSMEARAAMADFDAATGRWTLYANTQGGWLVKNLMAPLFNADPEKFRIVTPDVGGGFGMKLFLYAEHVLTCYAARKLGRPVKWVSDRSEAFLCRHAGPRQRHAGRAGDRRGRQVPGAADAQRRPTWARIFPISRRSFPTFAGTSVLASIYGFQAVYANVLGVFTNTVPVDAYRGAGRPEANYLVERLVDAAARESEDRPRRIAPPQHGAAVARCRTRRRSASRMTAAISAGCSTPRWRRWTTPVSPRAARKRRSAASGAASGFAYYLEATGGDPTERAEIRFADDGFVDVYVGTQSTGQGHETAYVQLTATRLGIDGEKIRIRQGDTDTIPVGGGTGGARSLYSEGQAILLTTDTVIAKGKQAAAEMLEAAPADIAFADGRFSIVGTDRGVDIMTLAATQRQKAAAGEPAITLDAAEVAQYRLPHLPQRLPHRGGRDRSGNRRGRTWCATRCSTMSARR